MFQADIAFPMMWMAQIKGQMKVTLTPRPPCNSTCPTLYNTLHEGDVCKYLLLARNISCKGSFTCNASHVVFSRWFALQLSLL